MIGVGNSTQLSEREVVGGYVARNYCGSQSLSSLINFICTQTVKLHDCCSLSKLSWHDQKCSK